MCVYLVCWHVVAPETAACPAGLTHLAAARLRDSLPEAFQMAVWAGGLPGAGRRGAPGARSGLEAMNHGQLTSEGDWMALEMPLSEGRGGQGRS